MAMPQRTMSKCARGSRRVAALLAVWREPRVARLELRGKPGEAVELVEEEARVVLVGGGEVAHQAGQGAAGGSARRASRVLVAHAEPAHARVELDVHARAEPQRLGEERRDQTTTSAPAAHGPVELGAGEGAEDEDRAR